MQRRRLIVIALAALVAAIVGFRLHRGSDADAPSQRAQDASRQERDNGMTAELDALAQRLHALERREAQLSSELARKAKEAGSMERNGKADEGVSRDAEDLELSPEERAATELAVLEETLAHEARDPEWSPEAEAHLRTTGAALQEQGVSLREAACGTTLCRVTLGIEQGKDGVTSSRTFLSMLQWPAPSMMHIDSGEGQTTIAYFARAGHVLFEEGAGP